MIFDLIYFCRTPLPTLVLEFNAKASRNKTKVKNYLDPSLLPTKAAATVMAMTVCSAWRRYYAYIMADSRTFITIIITHITQCMPISCLRTKQTTCRVGRFAKIKSSHRAPIETCRRQHHRTAPIFLIRKQLIRAESLFLMVICEFRSDRGRWLDVNCARKTDEIVNSAHFFFFR